MLIKCSWCEEQFEDEEIGVSFEFKLIPSWNHGGLCCNLCEKEIIESCQLSQVEQEENGLENDSLL